jgi:hypothetical protein
MSQTAPFTYAPALLAKKRIVPAISSSVPARFRGTVMAMVRGSSLEFGVKLLFVISGKRCWLSEIQAMDKRKKDVPLGQTPGAKTLLRIPQGASKLARHLPRCVLATLDNVYDIDTILGSTLNEPDDETVITCDE